ncbi:MAG: cell division topological specificity factor MinE [Gemmatimonadetes bacterium]|nr:MAG: cell division topological specificity factor MinE [Gemmatimonadota bacterium]
MDWITKWFGKGQSSKDSAKQRLKLVLVHDRATISPHLIEALKEEIMDVIRKYIEVDDSGLDISLDESGDSVALLANIPIKGLRRNSNPANSM